MELLSLVQRRRAGDLLKKHLLASIRLEVIHLGVGGLVGRADPGISDFPSHRSERVYVAEIISRTPFPNWRGKENTWTSLFLYTAV